MKLQGRIPVEPLDDERLTNIERKLVVGVSELQAPPERASRWTLAVAGAAMAVTVAGFVGWKLHTPPSEAPAVARAEAPYTMSSTSEVKVTHSGTRTDLAMGKGMVKLDVVHDTGRLLVVHAGDTDIEDVGTKFSVDYDGKNHVEVRVTEGEVKVARGGKEFAVTASNGWTTETGTITLAQLDAQSSAVIAAEDSQHGDTQSGTGDTTHVGEQHVGAEVRGGSASGSDARGTTMGSDARGSTAGVGSGSGSKRHKAGETNVKKAILAIELNPLPGSLQDYREQLKAAGDAEDKSRLLYSIAVKQHEAKDDGGALHTIEGIVNHRTKDAAYKDAMWLQVRITCVHALDDQCRVAAQRYLNNLPDGVQAGIAQAILKEIAL